jgi:oligopeptide transport system substrate-binding protein
MASDHVSIEVLYNLQEGLVRFDDKLGIVPALADRWTVSSDRLTYTFFLREAKWSDGVRVSAEQFVWAWKRLLEPSQAAEYAYLLYDIVNAENYNRGSLADFSKVGVRAISDKVLEVRLSSPAAYFLNIPTLPATAPHRPEIVAAHPTDFTSPPHLCTTGPYVLARWDHDSKLVLEANPNFYGKPPHIKTVHLLVVKEDSTALNLYERGELDVAMRVPALSLDRVKERKDFHSYPVLRGYYFGFNVKAPPFDNVWVRKAFAHAVNRAEIVSAIKGGQVATNSWVPKGMAGFEGSAGLAFNPALSREYLAKAGYPGGHHFPQITLSYDSSELNRLVAEKIQYQWKSALNISEIKLQPEEWKSYLARLSGDPPQLFRMGWGADYPDAHNFLEIFTTMNGNNNTRWGNTRYDELIQQGARAETLPLRLRLYHEAQKILLEDEAIVIPIFQTSVDMMVKPRVKNFLIDPMENPRIRDAQFG